MEALLVFIHLDIDEVCILVIALVISIRCVTVHANDRMSATEPMRVKSKAELVARMGARTTF